MKLLVGCNGRTVLLNEDGTLGELGSDQLKLFLMGNQRDTEMVFFMKEETDRPDPIFKQYDLRIRTVSLNNTEDLRKVFASELAGEWDVVAQWIREVHPMGESWFNVTMADLKARPI